MEDKLIRELKLRRPIEIPSPLESPAIGAICFLLSLPLIAFILHRI